jgi:hypothetical protein
MDFLLVLAELPRGSFVCGEREKKEIFYVLAALFRVVDARKTRPKLYGAEKAKPPGSSNCARGFRVRKKS